MPGSKSIRVFKGWFDMDSASQIREADLCQSMASTLKSDCSWDSEKKCFWVRSKSEYFKHHCDTCAKDFNYPVQCTSCPVCSSQVSSKSVWIGRIEPPSEKEWSNSMNKVPVANPELLKRAQEDLRENPVHEEGFDWQHLRDNL